MNTHQITSVLLLSLKHMMRNCLPSVLIILSLSSSAFIFILCVSLINGINSNVDSSDSLKNSFVVYRKGSDNEMGSYISRDELLALQSLELSGTGKRSRFFGELATIVTSPKSGDDMQSGNLTLRGIESSALPARGITLINGRSFVPGQRELIVGDQLLRQYPDYALGSLVRMAGEDWEVVGVYRSSLKLAEVELMADIQLVQAIFMRAGTYTTLLVYSELNTNMLAGAVGKLSDENLTASSFGDFYASQLKSVSDVITYFGSSISTVVVLGATMGVLLMSLIVLKTKMNMFKILFSVGIRRVIIERAYLVEGLVLALFSGLVATTVSLVLVDDKLFSTLNASGLNQVTFKLNIGTAEVMVAIIVTAIIAVLSSWISVKRVENEIRLIN